TEYTFRVAAVNDEGTGEYSNEDSATPNAPVAYSGFSTYLGGAAESDLGHSASGIGLDTSGNIVIVGQTTSESFPLVNEMQSDFAGGIDFFITVLTPDGSTALISTYLGSDRDDWALVGRVDGSGNIYIAGVEYDVSANTPNISGFSMVDDPESGDVYLIKVNEDVDDVLYATAIGGTSYEDIYSDAMRVDDSGMVYLGGQTYSDDFPVTANAFQDTLTEVEDDSHDTFVMKIDTTVSGSNSLVYSSYLGGSGFDRVYGVNFDAAGNIYVVGETDSADFSGITDRKSTRLNSSHVKISYAVFCLKKKKNT